MQNTDSNDSASHDVPRDATQSQVANIFDAMRAYLWMLAEESLDEQTRQKVAPSDLVQQTIVEAHADFPNFRGATRAELRSWLRRILLNNVRNAQRHYRTQRRDASREMAVDARLVTAAQKSPSSLIAYHEEFEMLETALGRLNPQQRQAIELRSLRRLSFEQVGQKLGRSHDAARKLWFRALQKLKTEIARMKQGPGDPDLDT